VSLLPDWRGADEQRPAIRGEDEYSAAAIDFVLRDPYKPTTLEGFEGGRKGCAVHSKKIGY
jgi:hypothetical protein